MPSLDNDRFVSERTQALFHALIATGTSLAGLLALVSSAYADGGNHVLDELQQRVNAKAGKREPA